MSLTRQARKRNTKYHAGPERDRHRIARPIATRTRPHTGSADRSHTFGTALAEAGVDLPVLQALMGHDHVDSSAAYIHLAPAHVRAAYDAARDRQRAWQAGR